MLATKQMRVTKKIHGHGIEEWLLARSHQKNMRVGKKIEGGAKKDKGQKEGGQPRGLRRGSEKDPGGQKKGVPSKGGLLYYLF